MSYFGDPEETFCLPDDPDDQDEENQAAGEAKMEIDMGQLSELAEFLSDLDKAMIKYITRSSRLLFVDRPETWIEFHMSNAENLDLFSDLTPYEICDEFVSEVLPKIFEYDLTDDQSQALQLMAVHPEYRRVAHGFERLPKSQRISAAWEPRLNVDYRIVYETFDPPASPRKITTSLSFRSPDMSLHTVVTAHRRQSQKGGYAYGFSEETHAFFSTALSDDFELSGSVLLEPEELHHRLRWAKHDFETRSKLPINCVSAYRLRAKLRKLSELRRTAAQMMDQLFL